RSHQKRILQERMKRVSDIRLEWTTPKQRQAIELALEGKSLGEVADILGISRQGVDSLIQNARKRSKKLEAVKKKREQAMKEKGTAIQLSNDIEVLRVLHGWSKQEMADQLGISYTAYSYKENEPERFKINEIVCLAELFGKSVNDLLGL